MLSFLSFVFAVLTIWISFQDNPNDILLAGSMVSTAIYTAASIIESTLKKNLNKYLDK